MNTMLEHEIRALELQADNLNSWTQIAQTNEGGKILKELRSRIDTIRGKYRFVNVLDDKLHIKLAAMIASEEELLWLVDKLADSEQQKEYIDKQLSLLYSEMKTRIGDASAERRDNRLVAITGE